MCFRLPLSLLTVVACSFVIVLPTESSFASTSLEEEDVDLDLESMREQAHLDWAEADAEYRALIDANQQLRLTLDPEDEEAALDLEQRDAAEYEAGLRARQAADYYNELAGESVIDTDFYPVEIPPAGIEPVPDPAANELDISAEEESDSLQAEAEIFEDDAYAAVDELEYEETFPSVMQYATSVYTHSRGMSRAIGLGTLVKAIDFLSQPSARCGLSAGVGRRSERIAQDFLEYAILQRTARTECGDAFYNPRRLEQGSRRLRQNA